MGAVGSGHCHAASRFTGYRRNVRRQCAWFGCSAVATATYTFDSNARTVWLDTPFDGGARAGDLCARHARSLTPPRGWRLEDRRPGSSTPDAGQPTSEPVATRAEVDSEAELRVLLDAHTPLLARAFRSSGTV
jgi:hypothetical protein